jgi:hypothetical protein
MFLQEQHVSTQLRDHHQANVVMKFKMATHKQLAYPRDPEGTPTVYVLPFPISLLYQPDDDPLQFLDFVLSTYVAQELCLNDFEMVPVAPGISDVTFSFTLHMRQISIIRSLYFRILLAYFILILTIIIIIYRAFPR